MTRIMYDSVTAHDIPTSAEMVAGYVDGRYRWSDADWNRFRNVPHVRIAVSPLTNDGNCLDVETGDATPDQAPDWVLRRRAAGVDPSVYMNASTWGAVRHAFQVRHLPEPHYWVASWGGSRAIPPGAVALQYANPATSGGHFDLSAVADHWPGVDAASVPDPAPPLPAPQSQPSPSSEGLSVSEASFIYSQLAKVAAKVGVALDPLPGTAPEGTRVYVVQPGDSLSLIAQHYLGDAAKWPELYRLNESVIGPDPNLIHPGQHLALPS